jgi:branched-chain amino acid transport system substrate-binding protein
MKRMLSSLRITSLGITSLCVGLGVLVACAGFEPSSRGVSEAERREYAAAISQLPEDPVAAEASLKAFLRHWPQSRFSADASLQLGEFERQRGDTDAALGRFYSVLREFPKSRRIDSVRLAIATLEYERSQRDLAVQMLRDTNLKQLTVGERLVAYRLLADTAGSAGERVRWLAALRADTPDPEAQVPIDAEIDTLMALLDDAALAQLGFQIEPEVPAGRIWLALAEREIDRGDLELATEHFDRAHALPFIAAYAPRLSRVADRLERLASGGTGLPSFAAAGRDGLPDTRAAQGEIGVVLPLSGKFASFGEESLRGILLATGAFDAVTPEGERPAIHLLIRDTQGQADRAAAAVRELAQRDSVQVILGPLLAKECEAAASAAEFAGVPLVALTSREEVARDRSQVFRVRTMPKDEVETLAEHAIRDLGVTRFGILYPRDAYGRGLSDLFWNAVESRGGSIVALGSYETNVTDFSDSIRRLVGWELLTRQQKEAVELREAMITSARRLLPDEASLVRDEARSMLGPDGEQLPPIVDFEALFIPETHENVVLIAPQLAYNEVTGPVLLGAEAWNHADLVEIGRHHVDAARFTANFYAASPVEYVREFAQRYEVTFGIPAEDFAAQAYDAANLVLVPLARGVQSREGLREAVLATSAFAGVSGILSMNADGNARKRPFLLAVKRGKIVQLD